MKSLLFLLTLTSFSAFAQPLPALVADFKSMLLKSKISPIAEQTFCFDQAGIQGYQVDKMQRIASLTKLITTYFASETLDLNKQFETKLYISGDHLHIEGSRDPYFEEEKLLLLMEALNELKYLKFETVTFNADFIFSDAALSSHMDITPAHTRARLAFYFNPSNAKLIKNTWLAVAQFAKEEGIVLDKTKIPSLQATTIKLSDVNPLVDSAPTILSHKSRPFKDILKSMNVQSKNIVAQLVFLEASRVMSLDAFTASVGIPKTTYKIYNGSGLPVKTSSARYDNWATCKTLLQVIKGLSTSVSIRHNLILSDVLAVNGGSDLGSFRDRFLKQPETHEAVLSKTGTVINTSSLAGSLMIADTEVPFAILNHAANAPLARTFQDQFVARLFHHLGQPTPLVYAKIQIFPWDQSEFLEFDYQ